jgi:hypothetical protein
MVDGRLNLAVFVFMELRRAYPHHSKLQSMPSLSPEPAAGVPAPIASGPTQSITLFSPQVPTRRVTGPRRVAAA